MSNKDSAWLMSDQAAEIVEDRGQHRFTGCGSHGESMDGHYVAAAQARQTTCSLQYLCEKPGMYDRQHGERPPLI